MNRWQTNLRRTAWLMGLLTAGVLTLDLRAAETKPAYPASPNAENVKVIPDAWKTAPDKPATSAEIDALLTKEQKAEQLKPAPQTTDEQFIRRAYLDLTGKLPTPEEVESFIKSKDPEKRKKLIDELLGKEEFARHWAGYWRDVIVSRATDPRLRRIGGRAIESWLFEQFKENRNWGDIARDILTASGALRYDDTSKNNGAMYFLLAHIGADAVNERAAETSRVFLGIQIQCAQCHNHPTDLWKREQFHELAAFYTKLRERPVRDGQRIVGYELVAFGRGEHQMPDKDNPRQSTTVHPKFLLGQEPDKGMSDADRRKALADYVTSKDNYWFSAALANRVWGELMGQAFYLPVDNMGPLQQATYPDVLLRLAASFRATDYDVKEMFRLVMNTETYQRQTRLGETTDEHLHFAGIYPTRLRADSLWDALSKVLGPMQGPPPSDGRRPPGGGFFAARFGLQGMFKDTFDFDPSTKPDEVEGSVPQALLLMNNPTLNSKIKATGDTTLAKILKASPQDDEAIRSLYLHTLARKPSASELEKCLDYVKKVGNREEAFEDLLWTLINSTEFQTKR